MPLASAQPGVQVSQQRGHLLVAKAAIKAGHHSSAHENISPHRCVRGGSAAGQGRALKEMVQIGRNFLESQIVVLVAVGATKLIKAPALSLLRGERGRGTAAGHSGADAGRQPGANKN